MTAETDTIQIVPSDMQLKKGSHLIKSSLLREQIRVRLEILALPPRLWGTAPFCQHKATW